jgi:hypothetical protein
MNTNEKYLLSGYGFDELGAHLVLDTIFRHRTDRIKIHVLDKVFTLRKFEERYCIGWYDLSTFESHICPQKAKLKQNFTSCPQCNSASGFNPAFYNTAADKISIQQQKYNKRRHVVYLANFGIGVSKVGIASEDRVPVRLLEQGARAATIVKNCQNAYEARKIEEDINKKLGIPDSVKADKKRALLNQRFDYREAKIEIEDIKYRIATELELNVDNNELEDFNRIYLGRNILNANTIDLSNETPLTISGKGIGMIGDILVMEQNNRLFITSLKKYLAHVVAVDNFEQQNKYKVAPIQTTLF